MDEVVTTLKDGTKATIRPMRKDDFDRSFAFFRVIPEEDWVFLRADVTKRELVERRIRDIDTGRLKRLVALVGDQIVADGVLELDGHEWEEHVGELRLIVAPPYQRKGLGTLMVRELYALAARAEVQEIVLKVMRPQVAALHIFRRLGFHEDAVLRDYVKDRLGRKQDLVVMRRDLDALRKELEDYLADSDWQRTR